ncbi:hypothetical protein [Nostoc sp. TCL26-01]|uniref:hypothetical protein n=1 Tax=Nostoc sp. TCL26-01 TaxID=2576904 RepID=UPI0015BCA218|nr:hypothetical protein [Nostoc sp. TCL26-01]QLE55500.1 hypothetical protein FD725_08205 [Nostoc sp. TCL26-01]
MLKTFKAWLKGNNLEWIDDIPEVEDKLIQVHVTFLENELASQKKSRGQKMAQILENLAVSEPLTNIEPIAWQKETRQDRSLPG